MDDQLAREYIYFLTHALRQNGFDWVFEQFLEAERERGARDLDKADRDRPAEALSRLCEAGIRAIGDRAKLEMAVLRLPGAEAISFAPDPAVGLPEGDNVFRLDGNSSEDSEISGLLGALRRIAREANDD